MCARDSVHSVHSTTTFRILQISLLVFSLLHLPARHYPAFHPDLMDGVRGVFLGIAIGTLALLGRQRAR